MSSTRQGTKRGLHSLTENPLTAVSQTQVILQFAAGMSKTGKLERLPSPEAKVLQNSYIPVAV